MFGQKQMITENSEFTQFKKDIKNIKKLVPKICTASQDDSKFVKSINETYVYIGLAFAETDKDQAYLDFHKRISRRRLNGENIRHFI
eukprot:12812062-Heterocapsa_arctica.AAC.1